MGDCYDREHGIQAIIDVEALAGIEVTPEQAADVWDSMIERDREHVTYAHRSMCGGFRDDDDNLE